MPLSWSKSFETMKMTTLVKKQAGVLLCEEYRVVILLIKQKHFELNRNYPRWALGIKEWNQSGTWEL